MTRKPPAVPNDEYDEVRQYGSLSIARKGRFTFLENRASPEEHKQALEEIRGSMGEYVEATEKEIQDLERLLQQYSPLDVVGYIAFRNHITNFETYKEIESKENLAYAEYVALLYLCHTRGEYPDKESVILPDAIEDIQDRVRKLFNRQTFYLAFRDVDPDRTERDTARELRVSSLMHSLLVGDMAYPEHRQELTRGIFAPMSDDLRRLLGFSVDDAFQMAEGIRSLMSHRLEEKRSRVREMVKRLLKVVKICRLKSRLEGEFPPQIVQELAAMKPSEARARATWIGFAWVCSNLGTTLGFSAKELSGILGLELQVVEAYLQCFSIGFGTVDPKYYRYPAPTHPLRTTPIIRVEDTYLCPIPASLNSGFRLRLEELLNPENRNSLNKDAELWKTYERTRSGYLERKSMEYLGGALKFGRCYQNLSYRIVENGEEHDAELDGLAILDNTLFIVEAKSGALSQPARRGAPSLVEDMAKLVDSAYGQALRAKQFILGAAKPEFRLPDGSRLIISKEGIDVIFLVNVTLENLDSFVVNLYKLRDIGLINRGEYPWSVALTDLRVISEVVSSSAEFVHYLLRRLRINELGFIEAQDELDWFGYYLHEGLYFEDLKAADPRNRIITLSTFTTELDDYYYYLAGARKTPAPQPRQPMPQTLRQLIDELESGHDSGYVRAACGLLDMGDQSRKEFSTNLQRMRRRTMQDDEIHSFTMEFDDPRIGLSCITAPPSKALELPGTLKALGDHRISVAKDTVWIGLGSLASSNKLISHLLVIKA